ncbi:MAG TPA: hypothetical protein VEY07_02595, partial [Thermoplasmata archaeon]|nr:hypothetical protein [Thermoplasmata archaeon]
QEIARTAEVWVDSGVRTSDQAIDVVVAGAFRTVLSTAYLRGESELRQAWKLSPEMAFEIATEASVVRASSPEFSNQAPERLAAMARSIGVRDVVYSPASGPVDWRLAGDLSRGGALWVGGVFDRDDIGRLQQSGAVGGIFSIREELGLLREGAEPTT